MAFASEASNLIPGDANAQPDVFVHDTQTGETTRVSVSSSGAQGDGNSGFDEGAIPRITPDGRYVVFGSYATNLVPGDTNGVADLFVHDRDTGETSRVSISSTGLEANDYSFLPSISADGRHVAFTSFATNLIPGDTNAARDIFVHDRQTGDTSLVSVAGNGAQADDVSIWSAISASGRFVAFDSYASNLVPGDTNMVQDVFVHDRSTGQTIRTSVSSSGTPGNDDSLVPSISATGRYVAFTSAATNFTPGDSNGSNDIFVHDVQTGATSRVSIADDGTHGNGPSNLSDISASGRYVGFESEATNLVPGDNNGFTDLFVHDRLSQKTTRVSVGESGAQGDDDTTSAAISAEGGYVAFNSIASNLVPGDGNGLGDVFVYQYLADPVFPPPPPPPPIGGETVGLVDPASGVWHLRDDSGAVSSFFYGDPGDVPFMGDWDCDGVDTPGLFRLSDAFAYLRNTNSQGVADIRFFFGNPSDIPLAGDFDGDGCDTLSLYRPSEQRFYIINQLGANNGGIGPAEFSFLFGNPGDKPFVGDFDGDRVDEVGLHRESTGFVYYRNTLDTGIASNEFFFGDPGDRFVAGDWGIVDDVDTPGLFRPGNTTFYFRHTNTQGNADSQLQWGEPGWLPVAGDWGNRRRR